MIDDEDFEELMDEAKRVPMLDVLDMLDLERPGPGGFIQSIFRDERTPSLHIDNELWYDFGEGRGGDAIAFVMAFYGCSFRRAVMQIARGIDPASVRDDMERGRRVERIPDLRAYMEEHSRPVPTIAMGTNNWKAALQHKWGVNPTWAVTTFDLRRPNEDADQLWAPHYDTQGRVTAIKIRDLKGAKWTVTGSRFTELYRSQSTPPTGDEAWVVEGESDTWAMSSKLDDASVFGLPSGAATWREAFANQLRSFKRVYVALDDDEVGQKATRKITAALPGSRAVAVPGGRVAEALMDGWDPTANQGETNGHQG